MPGRDTSKVALMRRAPTTNRFATAPIDSAEEVFFESIQPAVAHEDGEAIMYRARRVGRWENDDWVGQVSSFDLKHLMTHDVTPCGTSLRAPSW